jgi:uncharacterized protein YodC (DUF2158 family)
MESDPVIPNPQSFTPGNRVVLQSGGPAMTVVDVGARTGLVFCRWTGGDGESREASFPADTLAAYDVEWVRHWHWSWPPGPAVA